LSSCNEWVRQGLGGLHFGQNILRSFQFPFKIVASNEDVLKGIFHLELKDLFHHHKLLSVQLEQGMLPANHQQ
jgi:hypothetical protein